MAQEEYAGKRLTVSGEVTDAFGLAFLRYFVVADGTRAIAVATN
jgi:hypothetical protein